MAAESTTIANPVWIQIMTMINMKLFQGRWPSQNTGSLPNACQMLFSKPI